MSKKSGRQSDKTVDSTQQKSFWHQFTGWLESNRGFKSVSLALFAFAIMIRLVIWSEASEGIIPNAHRWDQSDMHFFDFWAKSIARGDWWNEKGPHPYHLWHKQLTDLYFKANPQDTAQYLSKANALKSIDPDMSMGKALIYDWYGGKAFHQEPLYVYLIAVTYAILGEDVRYVFSWQLFLGALSCMLIFWIGRRWFSSWVGLLAAFLALFCGPLVFFDFVLLRSTLTVFLLLWLLYLYGRLNDTQSSSSYALFGFVSALSVLNYSYFLLLIVAIVVWLLWQQKFNLRPYAKHYGLLTMGFILPFIPLIVRNIHLDLPPLTLASNGGITFITANALISEPYLPFFIHFDTLLDIMAKTGGDTWGSLVETLKTHTVGSYISLLWTKCKVIFAPFEIPNNINYYLVKRFVPAFDFLPVGQGLLAAAGIAGLIAMLFTRWRDGLIMLIFWGLAIFPMIYFSGLARHRVPLLALEIIAAAFFIYYLIYKSKSTQKWVAALAIIGSVALFYWVRSNDQPKRTPYEYFEYRFVYDSIYRPIILDFENKQDWTSLVRNTQKIIDARPEYMDTLITKLTVSDSRQPDVVGLYANFYQMHSAALAKNNQESESQIYRERADILRSRAEAMKAMFGTQ